MSFSELIAPMLHQLRSGGSRISVIASIARQIMDLYLLFDNVLEMFRWIDEYGSWATVCERYRLGHHEFKKTPAAAAGVLVQKTEKVAASELCGKIPVDFEADANLDKCGCAPGHFRLLACYAVNLAPFSFE